MSRLVGQGQWRHVCLWVLGLLVLSLRSTHNGILAAQLSKGDQAQGPQVAGVKQPGAGWRAGRRRKLHDNTGSSCGIQCLEYGTCNEELGRCDCPRHRMGRHCQEEYKDQQSLCRHYNFEQQEQCTQLAETGSCMNDCSDRGDCVGGWCHCNPGFYGTSCELSLDPETGKPLLLAGLGTYVPSDLGPRFYVYDLPPKYNTWYRAHSTERPPLYTLVWQRILASGRQTTDGDSADFFFVPVSSRRPRFERRRLVEAVAYIRTTWPWWDRLGGERHIMLASGDQGRTDVTRDLPDLEAATRNVTFLSMWGLQNKHATLGPPSHRPGLDVVLPTMAVPFLQDPLATPLNPRMPPAQKSLQLSFAGGICSTSDRQALCTEAPEHEFNNSTFTYSLGVRQKVYRWFRRLPGYSIKSSYPEAQREMAASKFCLAPIGIGYSRRNVLAALMGCVPVTVADGVVQPFEPELDWRSFSVAVPEADVARLPELLKGVPEEKLKEMQASLSCAARHLHWSTVFGGLFGETGRYDAFETLMAILRARLRHPGAPPSSLRELDSELSAFMSCQVGPDDATTQASPLCTVDKGDFRRLAPTPPCSTFGWFGIRGGAICQSRFLMTQCPRPWQAEPPGNRTDTLEEQGTSPNMTETVQQLVERYNNATGELLDDVVDVMREGNPMVDL